MSAITSKPTKAQEIVRSQIRTNATSSLVMALILASIFTASQFLESSGLQAIATAGVYGYLIVVPITVLRILGIQRRAEAAEESESSGTQ